ncbi:MAG: hypothetical protein ABSC06_23845 [Rhodopila sp.]|jgi:hypothetical protein
MKRLVFQQQDGLGSLRLLDDPLGGDRGFNRGSGSTRQAVMNPIPVLPYQVGAVRCPG